MNTFNPHGGILRQFTDERVQAQREEVNLLKVKWQRWDQNPDRVLVLSTILYYVRKTDINKRESILIQKYQTLSIPLSSSVTFSSMLDKLHILFSPTLLYVPHFFLFRSFQIGVTFLFTYVIFIFIVLYACFLECSIIKRFQDKPLILRV